MSVVVKPYTHLQATPASVWIIHHKLNRPAVDIVVFNSVGERIRGRVEQDSSDPLNKSKVSFFEKGEPVKLTGVAEAYHVGCTQDFITGTNLGVQSFDSAGLSAAAEGSRVLVQKPSVQHVSLSKSRTGLQPVQTTNKRVSLSSSAGRGSVSLSSSSGRVGLSKKCT